MGAALAVLFGCTSTDNRASRPQAAADQAPETAATTGTTPLETVETRENRLRLMDQNDDDFVDRQEAEAFYRWRFDRLDEDGDGRLSRAELEVEFPGVPDPEAGVEELVGVTKDGYARAELERFDGRAETTGMMSTADFHDMVQSSGALRRDWPR